MQTEKTCQALLELLDVMRTLRSPDGCPWDAEQTPLSLAPYILEEAAEVVDAIESGNPAAIMDETGDLLLQVVFLAQIFSEQEAFDFADVANSISRKLVRRHPHVFEQSNNALSAAELDRQWETIKRSENPEADASNHPFGHIPVNLPALQRARKILDRAAKVDLLDRIDSDCQPSEPFTEAEFGQELFKLTAQGRRYGLDAEQALRQHIRRLLDDTRDVKRIDSAADIS